MFCLIALFGHVMLLWNELCPILKIVLLCRLLIIKNYMIAKSYLIKKLLSIITIIIYYVLRSCIIWHIVVEYIIKLFGIVLYI